MASLGHYELNMTKHSTDIEYIYGYIKLNFTSKLAS